MMKHGLLSLALLAFTTLEAQITWYLGPKIGVIETTFHYEEAVTRPPAGMRPTPTVNLKRADASQYAGTFGGVVGQLWQATPHLALALEFAGFYNNGTADYAWLYDADGDSNFSRAVLQGNIEFVACPTVNVSSSCSAYFRGGYSLGFVRNRNQLLSDLPPYTAIDAQRSHKNLSGYVVGLGMKAWVWGDLSIFAEFNQYGYLTPTITGTLVDFQVGPTATTQIEINRVNASAFTLGAGIDF